MFKVNVLANFLGQSWVAVIGIVFVPFYIKWLGIEAYGLIGLFAMLSVWLGLLDVGLTPALAREMGRFLGGTHTPQSIWNLLRTVELIAAAIALAIAGAVFGASEWLAHSWVQTESLSKDSVAQAFAAMGVVIALRFLEGVYRSSIVGLQRQVLYNLVNCILATARAVGALMLLAWISPTIQAFFLWQGILSLLSVAVLAGITYASLPAGARSANFSLSTLRNVWRFAGGMVGITFLSLLLTQVDKVLLSKLLKLTDFGYYTLASLGAGALYMLISPVTQACYARFCELQARDDAAALADTFHESAQFVTVFAGSAALVLSTFSEPVLHIWSQDAQLARQVSPLLSILVIGNLLNGLMWVPIHLQLAHGRTRLAATMNLVAVMVVVPALLWITTSYGAEGAAWVWVALNSGYVLIGSHFLYRKVLTSEKWRWFSADIAQPLAAATAMVLFVRHSAPPARSHLEELVLVAVAAVLTAGAALLAANRTRVQLSAFVKKYLPKQATSI